MIRAYLLSQTPPAALSGRRLAAWRKLVELGDDNLPIHHQTEEGRRYRAAELAKRPNAELAAIARDITWGMCCKKPYRLATFPGLAVLDGNLLAVILDLGGGESVPLPVWPINNGAILDDHARLGALVTVVGDILRRFEAFAISDAPLLHSTLKSWTEGSLVIDAKLMARRLERPVKGNRRPHRTTAENVEKRDRLKRENVTDAVVQLLIGAHAFFYIGWQEPIARSTEEESGDADGDGDGGRVDTSDVDPTSDDDVADVEDAGVREYEEGDDNAACYDAAATNYDRDGERDEDAHDYEPNDE